jgi:transposase
MEISSVPAASAALEKPATVFVALELSKARWLVGIHSPVADKISRHSVAGGDSRGLLELVARARRQAEERLGQPAAVICCYEAGYDGFWLHRLLQANGIENHVMDPASLPVDRRARRAKTDRIDLAALLRALMAWHRGEKQVCRMVRVPSTEDEDRRRRSRERERLINERVQHIGRIKALLRTQGIRDFEPTRRDWQERLDALRTGDGRCLLPALKAEIGRECRRLRLVIDMLKAVEAERAEAQAASGDQRAALLARLAGIGDVSAHLLVNEVFYRDFGNRRELASFFGLASSPYSSGSVQRDQGLSRAGNPRARRVAIEIAWMWLRHQPGSGLSRWFRDRVGTTRGRFRRIMIVALARKLMVQLWRYLATGIVPEGAIMTAA